MQTRNAPFSSVPSLSISPELVSLGRRKVYSSSPPFHLVSCTLISFSAATQTINQALSMVYLSNIPFLCQTSGQVVILGEVLSAKTTNARNNLSPSKG